MKMQDQSHKIRKNLITDTVTYIIVVKKTTLEISKSCNFSAHKKTTKKRAIAVNASCDEQF